MVRIYRRINRMPEMTAKAALRALAMILFENPQGPAGRVQANKEWNADTLQAIAQLVAVYDLAPR